MGFTITFQINNPIPANRDFEFDYFAHNDGPDDPTGHFDHVQVWDSHGGKPFDNLISALPSTTGQTYKTSVPMGALAPGYYDVSVTIPGSLGAGSTIIVQ